MASNELSVTWLVGNQTRQGCNMKLQQQWHAGACTCTNTVDARTCYVALRCTPQPAELVETCESAVVLMPCLSMKVAVWHAGKGIKSHPCQHVCCRDKERDVGSLSFEDLERDMLIVQSFAEKCPSHCKAIVRLYHHTATSERLPSLFPLSLCFLPHRTCHPWEQLHKAHHLSMFLRGAIHVVAFLERVVAICLWFR